MADAESEQLAWEARAGRLAAGAAGLALTLFVGGSIYGLTAIARRQPRTTGDLALIGRDPLDFILPAVIAGVAFVLFGVVLGFLYRVTKSRRPQLPAAALALLVFGAIVAGATLIAQRIDIANAAEPLRATRANADSPVRDQLRGRETLQVILGLNLGSYLALGLATVMISVSAMRAGLFSRFLGVLGVVAALSLVLPLIPLQILFMFWLGALAALFLDRWPGGRGPAWETGEAIPWPTMAQRNAEIDRRRAAADVGETADDDTDADRPEAPAASQPPSSPAPAASAESPNAGENENGASAQRPGDGGPPAELRPKRKRGRRR